MDRKKKTNKQAIRDFMVSVIQAMKYEWTDRRDRTIRLDAKELLQRLEPDKDIREQEIDEICSW